MARFKRAYPGSAFIHEAQTASHSGTAALTGAGQAAGTGIVTSDMTEPAVTGGFVPRGPVCG